jgi:hypothetical protein
MIGLPGVVEEGSSQFSPAVDSLPTGIDSTSSGSGASSLGFLPLHKSAMERTPTKSGSNTKTQNNQPNRQTSAIQGQRALPSLVSFQAGARSSRVFCMAPTPSSAHICYGLPDCSPSAGTPKLDRSSICHSGCDILKRCREGICAPFTERILAPQTLEFRASGCRCADKPRSRTEHILNKRSYAPSLRTKS